jgi:hypothetical protein
MKHSLPIILRFRTVALTVFHAQSLCAKKREGLSNFLEGKKSILLSDRKKKENTSKDSILWKEVIHMITMLVEEQRGIITYSANQSVSKNSTKGKRRNVDKEESDDQEPLQNGEVDNVSSSAADVDLTTSNTEDSNTCDEFLINVSGTRSDIDDASPTKTNIVDVEKLESQSPSVNNHSKNNSDNVGIGGAKKGNSFLSLKNHNIHSIKDSLTHATTSLKAGVNKTKSSVRKAIDVAIDLGGSDDIRGDHQSPPTSATKNRQSNTSIIASTPEHQKIKPQTSQDNHYVAGGLISAKSKSSEKSKNFLGFGKQGTDSEDEDSDLFAVRVFLIMQILYQSFLLVLYSNFQL